MSSDIETVVKTTVYRTSDGRNHDSEAAAVLHARMLRWFEFCEEIGVGVGYAETIWDNRPAAVNILGLVVPKS